MMFYLDEISIEECSKNGEQHTTCTIPANYNLNRYQSLYINSATVRAPFVVPWTRSSDKVKGKKEKMNSLAYDQRRFL